MTIRGEPLLRGSIPPYSTLIFTVELVDITPDASAKPAAAAPAAEKPAAKAAPAKAKKAAKNAAPAALDTSALLKKKQDRTDYKG